MVKDALTYLGIAAIGGTAIGAGSVALGETERARIHQIVREVGIRAGWWRARDPQPGDYWRRCDDARAAGTAPIHASEPGYRPPLDRDGDGIACEPYRGM
ncbi:excalibur calcium-binding domain-containing protein [Sphingomonas canadensis]|uniref:Excalibur calcium-binding domain-containing protein n=1 Tax=Sphingomonas canadensis TaxID=1219257 RepID=A0ABW3H3J4_9SPHN|nr:excalibur calcium-binding domain-containing protein [Sphingomonas canadensis]MCW3835503.1 excalibur calcium-binding domain-containing protein [Sphingomonas canadensis]